MMIDYRDEKNGKTSVRLIRGGVIVHDFVNVKIERNR